MFNPDGTITKSEEEVGKRFEKVEADDALITQEQVSKDDGIIVNDGVVDDEYRQDGENQYIHIDESAM